MAKKQAQFRFEETFYKDIQVLAENEGLSITEIVKNAIGLYATLYDRTKGKKIKFYFEEEDNSRCEVILPWLPYKH
jgi:predicted transcriptional regulator